MTDFAAAAWTTRLDPQYTTMFGVGELHNVMFEPPGWPGKGPIVSLLIPECELQFHFLAEDGQPVAMINRPAKNRNVKQWTRFACERAVEYGAVLGLLCDTAEQADVGARRIAKLLPRYRRIALERMNDPRTRVRAKLS
jgi:hypothetical protein